MGRARKKSVASAGEGDMTVWYRRALPILRAFATTNIASGHAVRGVVRPEALSSLRTARAEAGIA
jgi:hypothetical protein